MGDWGSITLGTPWMDLSVVPPKDILGHLSTDFHLLLIEGCSCSFNSSLCVVVPTHCWAGFSFRENPEEQNRAVLWLTVDVRCCQTVWELSTVAALRKGSCNEGMCGSVPQVSVLIVHAFYYLDHLVSLSHCHWPFKVVAGIIAKRNL